MTTVDSGVALAQNAKSSRRRSRIPLAVIAALMISAGAMYSYDHDAIKGVPVIGHLPWRLMIGNTAAQPAGPRPEGGVVDRHPQELSEARRLSPKVLFIGDSLTAHWLEEGREVWEAQFAPLGAA